MKKTVSVPLEWAERIKKTLEQLADYMDDGIKAGEGNSDFVRNHALVLGVCIESTISGKPLFYSLESRFSAPKARVD